MVSTGTNNMTMDNSNETSFQYYPVLLAIYTVVLLFGTISQSIMINIFKSRHTSTSIAVLNLIFTHFIFLFTVPFRIYYYSTHYWGLGYVWCKWVSAMIHIHMYMSFIFYVIILMMRLIKFYCKLEMVGDIDKLRALGGSAVVWIVVLVMVPCILSLSYGNNPDNNGTLDNSNDTKYCFKFGKSIYSGAKVINYIISTLIIIVTIVLTALQANVLRDLYMKNRQRFTSHQDFGHHLKSLCFALIMVVCFVPYHMFRLYYLEHIELQALNEVLLTLTTFNCLDMVTFLGGRVCSVCIPGWAT